MRKPILKDSRNQRSLRANTRLLLYDVSPAGDDEVLGVSQTEGYLLAMPRRELRDLADVEVGNHLVDLGTSEVEGIDLPLGDVELRGVFLAPSEGVNYRGGAQALGDDQYAYLVQ